MRTDPAPLRLTREERKAQTRERLLETARDVLLERGYNAATLDGIALAAGVTKGAVYSNFAGKADLFLAVLDARTERRAPQFERASMASETLDDLARLHARNAVADDPDGRWASVLVEAWAAAVDDEPFRLALRARTRAANAVVGTRVLEIATRSGVGFPYPIESVAQATGAMLRGLLLQRLVDPDRVDAEFVEEAFAALVRGMTRPATGGESDGNRS
jgi:AcrR family transcriptional regulator